MQFGIVQQEKFKAEDGAYSLVTEREVYDSQITATDAEAILLRNYYLRQGQSIYVGNVSSNPQAAAKTFRLFPSGDTITLNLVYPKPEKSELRLYLSKRAGFFPEAGYVWFIFVRKGSQDIWIGAMPEKIWRNENSFGRNEELLENTQSVDVDNTDAIILNKQLGEGSLTREAKEQTRIEFVRRREIALLRMQKSKFKCEFDPSHHLFIAKATGCPYLEAHHLIPIRFQQQLHSLPLDSIDNICCLCPNCHRAIHHAEDDVVKQMLLKLYTIRDIGKHFHLHLFDLERFYAVEQIVN